MGPRTILVPLDSSDFGETALPFALGVARDLDASIELLSVYDDHPVVAGWSLDPSVLRSAYQAYHADVVGRIEAVSDVAVASQVIPGGIGRRVVDYAQRTEPHMVVMSTHGRGPISRAWLGSVADRMVRHASMPILLIRPTDGGVGARDLTPAPAFRNIVVALDGSRRAEQGLDRAHQVGAVGASYTLVRAVAEPNIPSVYLPDAARLRAEYIERESEEAEQYVEAVSRDFGERGDEVSTRVIPGGNVAADILRLAEETNADLIVVSSRGRGGVARLALGSVTEKILRGADTPVLVVPAL